MRELLRDELKVAMRARDRVAVSALRSAIARIDNAEAMPVDTPLPAATGGEDSQAAQNAGVAGSVVGVGNTEIARRELSEADTRGLVAGEAAEREDHALTYDHLGQDDAAQRLRAEAAVLRQALERG